jgi:hypothetical protein
MHAVTTACRTDRCAVRRAAQHRARARLLPLQVERAQGIAADNRGGSGTSQHHITITCAQAHCACADMQRTEVLNEGTPTPLAGQHPNIARVELCGTDGVLTIDGDEYTDVAYSLHEYCACGPRLALPRAMACVCVPRVVVCILYHVSWCVYVACCTLCSNGDLLSYIEKRPLDCDVARHYFRKMVSALVRPRNLPPPPSTRARTHPRTHAGTHMRVLIRTHSRGLNRTICTSTTSRTATSSPTRLCSTSISKSKW